MSSLVPEALRKQLRRLADAGLSLPGLTSELDRYRDMLRGEQYDELWLYCWALDRGKERRFLSPLSNGQQWNYA